MNGTAALKRIFYWDSLSFPTWLEHTLRIRGFKSSEISSSYFNRVLHNFIEARLFSKTQIKYRFAHPVWTSEDSSCAREIRAYKDIFFIYYSNLSKSFIDALLTSVSSNSSNSSNSSSPFSYNSSFIFELHEGSENKFNTYK